MTDKLKPGPETDARVATEVMGWTRYQRRDMSVVGDAWRSSDGDFMCWADQWHPSADITAAWEVLEHTGLLEENRLWKKSGVWKVGTTYDYEDYLLASADTAPMAICEAALAAVKNNRQA